MHAHVSLLQCPKAIGEFSTSFMGTRDLRFQNGHRTNVRSICQCRILSYALNAALPLAPHQWVETTCGWYMVEKVRCAEHVHCTWNCFYRRNKYMSSALSCCTLLSERIYGQAALSTYGQPPKSHWASHHAVTTTIHWNNCLRGNHAATTEYKSCRAS